MQIYTRVYSNSSVGRLVSAKGAEGGPLSDTDLLEEFRKHSNKHNREPTALVSGSNRIVDTVKRAFDKHYVYGDSPANIWIAFIKAPLTADENAVRIHSAKELAGECNHPEPNSFSHEVVFEWAIPEKYVLHKVSLKTLIERELQEPCFLQPSILEVRRQAAREFRQNGPCEIGYYLGSFARKFGARAPLEWISHQYFDDCVQAKIVDNNIFRLKYADNHTETVDFEFFRDLEDGIKTDLYEWWLADIDFRADCEEFGEWRERTEERIVWDLIDFWESWLKPDCDERIAERSTEEELLYSEASEKMFTEHEKMRADIEAEAIRIGL